MGYGGLGRATHSAPSGKPDMQFMSPFADVWTTRPTTLRGYGHISDPARSYVGFGAFTPYELMLAAKTPGNPYATALLKPSGPTIENSGPGYVPGTALPGNTTLVPPAKIIGGSLPPTPLVASTLAPAASSPTFSTQPPRPGDFVPDDHDTVGIESADLSPAPAGGGAFDLSSNTTTLIAIAGAIWFAMQKPKGRVRRELRRRRRR